MRKLVTAAAVTQLVLILAACGGGGSSAKTPAAGAANSSPAAGGSAQPGGTVAPGPEDAFAASMLMSKSDFPAGYIQTAAAPENPNSPLRVACGNAPQNGRTGHAISDEFAQDKNAASVQESVIVFPDAATAAAALATVQTLIDCEVKALNDGKLNTTAATFSGAEASPVTIDAPGDKTVAYMVKASALASGSTTPQTVYLMTTYTIVGRVGYSIKVNGSSAPIAASQVNTYAQSASTKIKQQP